MQAPASLNRRTTEQDLQRICYLPSMTQYCHGIALVELEKGVALVLCDLAVIYANYLNSLVSDEYLAACFQTAS